MRVAVIHDWLVTNGGAERTLARILECYPQAEVFTLVDFLPQAERDFLGERAIHTSFLQRLPFARRHYRRYLPLMPTAVESFDLAGFDLLISSSFCVAKGLLSGPDQLHVSYVHSPMRYAWDLQHQYLQQHGLARGVRGLLTRQLLHHLRVWDVSTANGVDCFISNSQFVARRIWKIYRRESVVINPPVDTEFFHAADGVREDYYLTASRLVPYKCTRLLIDAFARLPQRRLIVIGDGPELARLRAAATPNVTLLGYQPNAIVREHMQRARAFVFAALEDFGIAPVEAQACGTPVIAYGKGGATETVIEGKTGVLFAEQSVAALLGAIQQFERRQSRFNPAEIRANALRFGAERFRQQFRACVEEQVRKPARVEVEATS
ncbi:MAG TPA: glycosyltransferase family 4 protein [Steroidobacteraceae bacterium]|nr:glycosyltransferase family 4 protein [Steroidobacteraceae bacterium]